MSSEKTPNAITVYALAGAIALIASIGGPAIAYGVSQGGRDAEISAIRDRVTVLESQNAELRKEVKAITDKIGDLKEVVGRIDENVKQLKDSAKKP